MRGPTNPSPTGLASPALLDVFDQIAFRPVRGEGVFLYTAEGERYLDFYGGHAVASLVAPHLRPAGQDGDQQP